MTAYNMSHAANTAFPLYRVRPFDSKRVAVTIHSVE